MVSKEMLRQIASKQKNDLFLDQESVHREVLDEIIPWIHDERVIIITGVRRCGKSTLLKQIMNTVSGWCYFNFEDERLLDFKAQEFEMLNEVLTEIYGLSKIYFFDEIQNVEKFEVFVRRLQDEKKKIIMTGSNAALLSKELGTRLTGRYKSFEVYPFSFKEYIDFKKIIVMKNDFYVMEKRVALLKHCQQYFVSGGLPEYLKNNDPEYVRTVYENIIYKDIITRYAIRKEKIFKELVNTLATQVASPFTYNSLKNKLGLSNAITVKEYVSYLSNAYLFFEVLKFSHSLTQQLSSPRKIYGADVAFNQICGLNFTPNNGKILENAVFIQLKRKNKELFYYSEDNECDFVIKEGAKISAAVQVCHTLNDSNREREIQGLGIAMDFFNLKEGLILTFEQEEEHIYKNKKIRITPFVQWIFQS